MATGFQIHVSVEPYFSLTGGHSCGLQLCFAKKKRALMKKKHRMFSSCFFSMALFSTVEPVLEIIWARPREVIAFSVL